MRRPAFQVACGNNCTVILAGPFKPPALFDLCIEKVRAHSELMNAMYEYKLPKDIIEQVEKHDFPKAIDTV